LLKSLPGVFRFSVAGFLAALVIWIFAAPFLSQSPIGQMLESGLMTLMLLLAVQAVGHRHRMLIIAVLLVSPAVASRWLIHVWPTLGMTVFYLASSMVFGGFVIWQMLRFILRAPRVDSEVLCAGISSYMLLGLLWSHAYMLVANMVPDAFMINGEIKTFTGMNSFTSIYFSFVTLTTVGFGDIVPNSPVARMLAAMEAMTGTLFVAVLISRLVSLYSQQPPSKPVDPKGD